METGKCKVACFRITDENGGGPYFDHPEVVVPIYLSQTNCSCNPEQRGGDDSGGEMAASGNDFSSVQSRATVGRSTLTLRATRCTSSSCPSCGVKSEKLKLPNIHRAYKYTPS